MSTEGNNQTSETDKVETLRRILGRQQSRDISYEEARDIGESLICFFEVLADETYIEQLAFENEEVVTA